MVRTIANGISTENTAPPVELLTLPGSDWHVWQWAVLRGPGFAASGLDRLAAPECAKAADAFLSEGPNAADPRAASDLFGEAFAAATRDATGHLVDIAADPLFREAVTWQSRNSLEALDGLVRTGPDAARNSRHRQREIVVTRYWQRYCGKNDTIGFFGPVCWARFDSGQPAAVRAEPGPGLVRQRVVDLEWRALNAFAERIAADPRYRPWLPVALQPQLAVAGDRLLRIGAPPRPLSPAGAALLARCDGTRTAAQVVAAVLAAGDTGLRKEADAYLLLTQYQEEGVLRWGLDLPQTIYAEAALRRGLAALGDPELRAEAEAAFGRLTAARDALAAAAGDPDAVRAALGGLDDAFVAVTGGATQHRAGATYAGRGVAYEETARDLDLTFGAPVLELLGASLVPLLRAARWLTVALADAYLAALRELYDEAVATTGKTATGAATVSLGELWYLANGVMFSDGPASVVMAEFTRRWADLLGLAAVEPGQRRVDLRGADLAAAIAEAFPAAAPGWSSARLHSPDLHLCAASAEALARGEFTAVLGEVHVSWITLDGGYLTRFHPDARELRAALHRDVGDRVVLLTTPGSQQFTARIAETLEGPEDLRLAYGAAPVPAEPDSVLPLAALTTTLVDGRLVASAPDGRTWPLVELFAPFLSMLAVDAFKLFAPGDHTPRVTVDKLVVHRESWRTTVGASGLTGPTGKADTEAARYLTVRRWRERLGLPERVFVRVGTELKPCYVDFTSPAYVAAFVAMVRAAHRSGGDAVSLSVGELLPGPDEAWVPDAAGRRYLSELRMVVRDPEPATTSTWTTSTWKNTRTET